VEGIPALATVRVWLLGALTIGLAASITLAESSLVALALVVALERRLTWWPLAAPVAAFAAWSLLAAVLSERPAESLYTCKSLLDLLAFYVVLAALPDARAARRFVTGVFVAVAVVALLSIAQVIACPGPEHARGLLAHFFHRCDRAHGFFSIYMTLAGVLTLVLTAALPPLLRPARDTAWRLPLWLVGVVTLALTYVRGAWIGFAVGVAVCLAAVRRLWIAVSALLVVVAVIATLLVGSPSLLRRARSIGDPADPTTHDRLAMLRGGLAMIRDHPVAGIGPGQVKHTYDRYAPPDAIRRHRGHLHDTPLQIAVERGLVGLAVWLWLWAAFFIRMLASVRGARDDEDNRALLVGVTAAIAAFLVGGLTEYNFGDTEVLLIAVTFMAAALAVVRDVPGWRRTVP